MKITVENLFNGLKEHNQNHYMIQLTGFDQNQNWFQITDMQPLTSDSYYISLNELSLTKNSSDELDVYLIPNLTEKKNHKTPRLLVADAYTIGSGGFISDEAKEKSSYYITFRKKLSKINPFLYDKDDDRIVFVGLQSIIDTFFRYPVTHAEIDETLDFLKNFKLTSTGLTKYSFDEQMWRNVVDHYNGYPPILIEAVKEGSVIYPNEPAVQITSLVGGMGELAAWFESKLLQTWATTERATQDVHWHKKLKKLIKDTCDYDDATCAFYASIMLQDFGDRAGMNYVESETLGMTHLYTFPGTDTCAGAYQAYKNGLSTPGLSVKALAHRIVQGYAKEEDAYKAIYNDANNGDIVSCVADCYDYWFATENHLLPLALKSRDENNGKVVVTRPDSGDAEEQVLWVCKLAKRHGLYREIIINGKTFYGGTTLKFIEGDGMDFETMYKISLKLIEFGFLPWEWGLFGVGGGLRNSLKRDNLSAKYALNAKGHDDQPVVKFSEEIGKTTLPGPFKLLRDHNSMIEHKTIVFLHEEGETILVPYYTGNGTEPFGVGMKDNFPEIKNRIEAQMNTMQGTLWTSENNGYPISKEVYDTRIQLLNQYAGKSHKRKENY